MRQAIFLDRDGTLVHPRHYPSSPQDLVVYDGIGPELHRLQGLGFRLVVVTNQSAIARGYFDETDLARMHRHLTRELGRFSVRLDRIYHCPHHPDGIIESLAIPCTCRKPQPGMLLRAAAELDLDLSACWLVGDILDDIEAGHRAGCRTVLVDLDTEPVPSEPLRRPDYVARHTTHALRIIQAVEGQQPDVDLAYLPPRWRTSALGACYG